MRTNLISAKAIACAAACFSLAGVAVPTAADVPITINAGVGYWFFDREVRGLEPENASTPVIGLEYAFTDNFSAEVFAAHDETEFDNTNISTDVTTWQLGGLYYVGAPAKVRPYFAFGAGEIELEADNFDTVETTLNGGVGVRWMFNDRVGARIESRAIYSVDESDTDLLLSASLSFYLGDVAAPAAAVVVAAAPVDSDGDGVNDDRDRCPGTPAGTRVDADGCPLSVAQVASVKLMVNFGFDSTNVQERYFSDLAELAAFLQRFEDVQVEVEGHTDSQGSADYNQSLSQNRSQAVVDLLVNRHGISRSRLQAKGYGESQPVASNDTEEGRAANRRVMATLEVEYED